MKKINTNLYCRIGRFSKKDEFHQEMASPTNVMLGTFMLWWGWLGFNCGSTFGVSGGNFYIIFDYELFNNSFWSHIL